MSGKEKLEDANKKVERIDKGITFLINLTEITRFKNIPMRNSFADEFFKKMKNYINLE
jgi:hypothetical protein